jgi:hypothetical protein
MTELMRHRRLDRTALERTVSELMTIAEAQAAQLDELLRRVESLSRAFPLQQEALEAFVASLVRRARDEESHERWRQYQEVIERVRAAVAGSLPTNARLLVVSRGDDNLLDLAGREGFHFPQAENGDYSGYHPASSAEAIEHLERLRGETGAGYLLIPKTALWWLDYYEEFRVHLQAGYQEVFRDDEACVVYALTRPQVVEADGENRANDLGGTHLQITRLVDALLPSSSGVVVAGGQLQLSGRRTWPLPLEGGPDELPAAQAIALLERHAAEGADYLLVPSTAAAWLERHPEVTQYLEECGRAIARRRYVCELFELGGASATPRGTTGADDGQASYDQIVAGVRQAVRGVVPRTATVVVVSKGDNALLDFDGRPGWHFPQTDGGVYAGYNPIDSQAAVGQIEELRSRGAGFFVLPSTAFWWLDHYPGLAAYLAECSARIWHDSLCAIFRLGDADARTHSHMVKHEL